MKHGTPERTLHGLMIELDRPEDLVDAVKKTRAAGYERLDAYAPFHVEDDGEQLGDQLGAESKYVALATLLGGVLGAATGYFMQWYSAVVDYPLNIGGRPFHSAPSFIPITFELTVLFGALAAMISMFALNHLPEPHHPVFNVPEFRRASQDRFFLCIEACDPAFDGERTKTFLADLARSLGSSREVLDVED